MKKFLLVLALVLSAVKIVEARSLYFCADEPLVVQIDGTVVCTKFGPIIEDKIIFLNGQRALMPEMVSIGMPGKEIVEVDLGDLVYGVRFKSLKILTIDNELIEFFDYDSLLREEIYDLPRIIYFRREEGNFILDIVYADGKKAVQEEKEEIKEDFEEEIKELEEEICLD